MTTLTDPPGAAWQPADAARRGGRAALAQALTQSRSRTLGLFAAFEAALAPNGLTVPYSPQLNPPLWELGHIGWFQDWWTTRNPERGRGAAADPDLARPPSRLVGADALYNSSLVAHAARWQLALPDAEATRDYLVATLEDSLRLLALAAESDDALYFWRLALFHEDMHAEAAVYMAQALGMALPDALAAPAGRCTTAADDARTLAITARNWALGCTAGGGFVFDNECASVRVPLAAFQIDASPVSWSRYLPFVEAGGYRDPRWWSVEGWAWLQTADGGSLTGEVIDAAGAPGPLRASRYLRQTAGNWQARRGGAWQALDLCAPAVHLSAYEADAWCRWAGRRLPTEAEWECAALTQPGLAWGAVWEWTASDFAPFPGFVPHPYRDYSAPWFGTRRVLRGGCAATSPRMKHPKYRNFFTPERNDIFAGFRSCAVNGAVPMDGGPTIRP